MSGGLCEGCGSGCGVSDRDTMGIWHVMCVRCWAEVRCLEMRRLESLGLWRDGKPVLVAAGHLPEEESK